MANGWLLWKTLRLEPEKSSENPSLLSLVATLPEAVREGKEGAVMYCGGERRDVVLEKTPPHPSMIRDRAPLPNGHCPGERLAAVSTVVEATSSCHLRWDCCAGVARSDE